MSAFTPSGRTALPQTAYDDYLVRHGFDSANPWGDFANSGLDADGVLLSGWLLKNSRLPANVPEEHSETAYMTDRAIAFMQDAMTRDEPWLCHLSYIKPHWPYIVPAPISEHDYSWSEMAKALDMSQEDARRVMIFDGRWKYVRCEGFDPVMFDLETDPDEVTDIGRSQTEEHVAVRARMEKALLAWATRHHTRVTATKEVLSKQGHGGGARYPDRLLG